MTTIPWHICILIPACNEEALLPRCLSSVLAACQTLPSFYTYDVVLAVDSSTDSTLQIGQFFLKDKGQVIELHTSNVGGARHLAAQTALRRYQGPLEHCWIANTDADCEVPPTWIHHQLIKANLNIQAITGIISVDSFSEHEKEVPTLFKKSYVIHSDNTHPHVHGANLGLRADLYHQIGGWNALTTAEDHDLWNRIKKSNVPYIADASLCVKTSGRKIGRAPNGFAAALAAHNKNEEWND